MRGKRFAVAGLLVFGMVALVQAQPGGFGRGGGGVTTLVTNKAVQEDIKLSEEQATKLAEWAKEFRTTSSKIREDEGVKFGKGGGGFGKIDEEMQKKINSANVKISAEAYKQLGDVLKKEQIDRVKQIERQQLGLRAFTNEEVVAALKLTDAQKTSLKEISDDAQKEQRSIMADAGLGGGKGGKGGKFDLEKFQEAQKKVQESQTAALKKAVDALDDTQKKTWKELTGPAFDLTKLQFQFGKKDAKKD